MPKGYPIGNPPVIGFMAYLINPAEHLAAASGGFVAPGNIAFVSYPRAIEALLSSYIDERIDRVDPLKRYNR